MFCKECGKKIDESDKFCGYCGTKIDYCEKKGRQIPISKRIFYELIIALVSFMCCFLCAFIPFVLIDYADEDLALALVNVPFRIWLYVFILFGGLYLYKTFKWLKIRQRWKNIFHKNK